MKGYVEIMDIRSIYNFKRSFKRRKIMDASKVKLVQEIGNEICEGCGPNADCGEDPVECFRVQNAVVMLDKYISNLKKSV